MPKTYSVQVDITFTKNIYDIEASSEAEAEKIAEERAYDHHNGEVIIGTQAVSVSEG